MFHSLLATLFICIAFVSTSQASGKRIGILVYDGVLTSDVTAPLEVFGVASRLTWFSDYEPVTISVSKQSTITTEEGLKIGVDGNILTSNGSLVSYQAALKLLSLMSSNSKAQEVADTLQYSRFSDKKF